jgi:hypothetical protein
LYTQDGLWQKKCEIKNLRNKMVGLIKSRFSDYPYSKAIMQVKDIYMEGRGVVLKMEIFFGSEKNVWLDCTALMEKYPGLYDIC